jgi:CHAD domain-containing protein
MPDRDRSQLLFSKINRAVEKLAKKPSPENVHGFRTAARRLETVLHETVPDQHRKLLKRLARWRRRAGAIRDVDVQIRALRSLKIPEEPQRKSQLVSSLLDLRARREKKFRDAFDNNKQRRLRKRLKKVEQAVGARRQSSADPLAKARQMFGELAKRQSAMTEESVHEYRLQCKHIRYVAELSDSPEAKALVADLVRIQDVTGDWRDWQMLTATAEAQFPARRSALLMALRNVSQAKFREAVRVCSQVREQVLGEREPPRKGAGSVKAERAAAANA